MSIKQTKLWLILIVMVSILIFIPALSYADSSSLPLNTIDSMAGFQDNLGSNLPPQLTGDFTIEAWVNPAATQPTNAAIIDFNSGNNTGIVIKQNGATVNNFGFDIGNGISSYGMNCQLQANVWQHLAFQRQGQTLNLYINGNLVATQGCFAGSITAPNADVTLGYSLTNGGNFNGRMSGIKFWNYARSQADLQTSMFATVLPFNGVGDLINLGVNFPINCNSNGSNMISIWVNPVNTQQINASIIDLEYSNNTSLKIQQNGTTPNNFDFIFNNGNSNYQISCQLQANQWQNIAFGISYVGSGVGQIFLYVNGNLVANQTVNNPNMGNQYALLNATIGNYFNGQLSDIKFWGSDNQNLITSEINGVSQLIQNVAGNLNLLSALGSSVEITNPALGPSGAITGGGFTTGVFGNNDNAYISSMGENSQVTFPGAVIPSNQGCIEFWAKLVGFPGSNDIGCPDSPRFIFTSGLGSYQGYSIALNGNDGHGGAGLCAFAGQGDTATGNYTNSFTYNQILGDDTAWHHYAITWDINGVPGRVYNIQMYLDGIPQGSPLLCGENHNPTSFPLPVDGLLMLVQNAYNSGQVVMENLKVWNYAKTDFSDRYDEIYADWQGPDISISAVDAGNQPYNGNGQTWVNTSEIVIDATAQDAPFGFQSGVNQATWTYWTVGAQTQSGAGTQVEITAEGITTVYFAVSDNAGNTSIAGTIVQIDRTPPVVIATGSNGWVNEPSVTASATATDVMSGVNNNTWCYKIDNGAWSNQSNANSSVTISDEGIHNVYFKVCDNVGNQSSGNDYAVVMIDRSPPYVASINITGAANGVWTNNPNPVTVTATLADTVPGAVFSKQYSFDGINWTTDSSSGNSTTLTVNQEGVTPIWFRGVDGAGNITVTDPNYPNSVVIKIDRGAPVVTAGILTPNVQDSIWTSQSQVNVGRDHRLQRVRVGELLVQDLYRLRRQCPVGSL